MRAHTFRRITDFYSSGLKVRGKALAQTQTKALARISMDYLKPLNYGDLAVGINYVVVLASKNVVYSP